MKPGVERVLRGIRAKVTKAPADVLPSILERAALKYMKAQRMHQDGKIDETTFDFVEEQFFTVRRECAARGVSTALERV